MRHNPKKILTFNSKESLQSYNLTRLTSREKTDIFASLTPHQLWLNTFRPTEILHSCHLDQSISTLRAVGPQKDAGLI